MAPWLHSGIYFYRGIRRRYVTFRAYRAMAVLADEDTRRSWSADRRGCPGNPGCAPHRSRGLPAFVREQTGVISISKTVLSGVPQSRSGTGPPALLSPPG